MSSSLDDKVVRMGLSGPTPLLGVAVPSCCMKYLLLLLLLLLLLVPLVLVLVLLVLVLHLVSRLVFLLAYTSYM